MRYRPLGERGPTVSVVGVGGNNFGSRLDEDGTKAVVHAALDAGITLFDTADMYGGSGERGGSRGDGERLLGAALKGRRDKAVLATKFGMEMGQEADRYGRAAPAATSGTPSSRPCAGWAPTGSTCTSTTSRTVSLRWKRPSPRSANWSTRARSATSAAPTSRPSSSPHAFVSTQARYHLLDRGVEQDLIPACLRHGVGLLPYYPLANGLLSGKYRRGEEPPPGSRLSWRAGLAHRRGPRQGRGALAHTAPNAGSPSSRSPWADSPRCPASAPSSAAP